MLDPEAIAEFRKLYRELYGHDLTEEEAHRRAANLLRLYEAVYGALLVEDEEDERDDKDPAAREARD